MAESESVDGALSLSSAAAVVTEDMLLEAVSAGDLESLTIWAKQDVRIPVALPLYVAARLGHLKVLRCLVRGLGADVNQVMRGDTPLKSAAKNGHLTVVRCLVHLGAEVLTADSDGSTALLVSATNGHYPTTQYLLEEASANMDDVDNAGQTVWDMLTVHFEGECDKGEIDPDGRTRLLRVMVLRGAPPPALVALLSPEDTGIVQKGARLRARLPAYLTHRRAYLDLRCPRISLLPGVLRALIYTFEGPATTEERWATGLGQAP
jgi:hypothetical protein